MLAPEVTVLADEDTGYISDDSSFYGDEATQTELNILARSSNRAPSTYWLNHPLTTASTNALKMNPDMASIAQTEDVVMSEAEPVNGLVARKALTASEPQASQHFDRKVTEEERLAGLRPTSTETKLYNPYAGEESARQLSETVSAFLSRLPPMTTSIADFGPWIWIANPYHQSRLTSQDWAGFMSTSENLMDDFQTQKAAVEKSMQGRPKGTITHKITPLRKILERQILDNAISKGCTAGKWMLFPRPDNVNRTWKLVAKGVANGELGMAAKVATDDGLNDGKGRLICVYTKDFSDLQDVKRVLIRLVELGLVKRKGPMGEERGVYYKCDAYTNLGILGGNEWGIKPSLYSSNEILEKGESWSLANDCR